MDMETVYWTCFIGGIAVTLLTVIFGDLLGSLFDGLFSFGSALFQPVTFVGAVTAFGGAGLILNRVTDWPSTYIVLCAAGIAVFSFLLLYFVYVKPMDDTESSTGMTMDEFTGLVGEILTTVPAEGYGEVLIHTISGNTNQIAASFDRKKIVEGTRVVVVEVKDSVLYVSPYDTHERSALD